MKNKTIALLFALMLTVLLSVSTTSAATLNPSDQMSQDTHLTTLIAGDNGTHDVFAHYPNGFTMKCYYRDGVLLYCDIIWTPSNPRPPLWP